MTAALEQDDSKLITQTIKSKHHQEVSLTQFSTGNEEPFKMPGPKMGPRPADFDENVIRQSPTFMKWESLGVGCSLKYACREFIKGQGDDEERLMRRIMIARRNNVRDHQTLKKARLRQQIATTDAPSVKDPTIHATRPPDIEVASSRRRRPASLFSDAQISSEMDADAVLATRSYRSWEELPNGAEFIYNQRYIKGREGHDWLLRKNIWRRMRYRRENKKMVEKFVAVPPPVPTFMPQQINEQEQEQDQQQQQQHQQEQQAAAAGQAEHLIVDTENQFPSLCSDHDTNPIPINQPTEHHAIVDHSKVVPVGPCHQNHDFQVENAAVEAAVAVAESYANVVPTSASSMAGLDHDNLEVGTAAALDAAARLAAATTDNISLVPEFEHTPGGGDII